MINEEEHLNFPMSYTCAMEQYQPLATNKTHDERIVYPYTNKATYQENNEERKPPLSGSISNSPNYRMRKYGKGVIPEPQVEFENLRERKRFRLNEDPWAIPTTSNVFHEHVDYTNMPVINKEDHAEPIYETGMDNTNHNNLISEETGPPQAIEEPNFTNDDGSNAPSHTIEYVEPDETACKEQLSTEEGQQEDPYKEFAKIVVETLHDIDDENTFKQVQRKVYKILLDAMEGKYKLNKDDTKNFNNNVSNRKLEKLRESLNQQDIKDTSRSVSESINQKVMQTIIDNAIHTIDGNTIVQAPRKRKAATVRKSPPQKQSCTELEGEKKKKKIAVSKIFETVLVNEEKGYEELRTNVTNKEEALRWLLDYSKGMCVNFNVKRSYKTEGKLTLFHRKYCCSHGDVRHKGKKRFNTGCEVTLDLKVKVVTPSIAERDKFRSKYPCSVIIKGEHNHATGSSEDLNKLRMLPETKEQLDRYFVVGMTSAQASRIHAEKLGFKLSLLSNSGISPSKRSVAYMYEVWHDAKPSSESGEDEFASIRKYIEKCPDVKVEMVVEGDKFCIVLVTPFMMRVHKELRESSEVVFVDSTSHVDELKTAVTSLLCAGPAGPAPLGIILASLHDEESFRKGLHLLKQILGKTAFFGQGYPQYFMTDTTEGERKILKEAWPESRHYLRICNILKKVWRWVQEEIHQIKDEDQQHFMKIAQELVHAKSQEEFYRLWGYFKQSPIAQQYYNFTWYLTKLLEQQDEWCLTHRVKKLLSSHQNINFAEVTMCIIKNRCKGFNTSQLLLYMNEVYDTYMKHRMLDLAIGRKSGKKLTIDISKKATEPIIEEVAHMVYTMKSKTNDQIHNVDMNVGVCNCKDAKNGKVCMHQLQCSEKYLLEMPQMFMSTPDNCRWLASIALGKEATPTLDFWKV